MHTMSVCSGKISKQYNKLTKIQIKDVHICLKFMVLCMTIEHLLSVIIAWTIVTGAKYEYMVKPVTI